MSVDGERLVGLGAGDDFADRCAWVLRRTLFLDCLTRPTDEYDSTLAERRCVTEACDVDWDALNQLSHVDRLFAYNELDDASIAEVMPAWTRRAYVVPTARTIETLPFLANGLFTVYPYEQRPSSGRMAADGGQLVRHPPDTTRVSDADHGADAIEALGVHRPIGIDPAFPASFQNRLRSRSRRDSVQIAIVCSDEKMVDELKAARSIYESTRPFPVTVACYHAVTVADLTDLLARRIDYFHYIGHIDDSGFECDDGKLDAAAVDTVNAELFFLNACHSARQAVELVNAGAVAGIVTRAAIANSAAVRVGTAIAEYLINGFPLGVALSFARDRSMIGHHYTVVGDPTLDVTRTKSGVPYHCEIERTGDDRYALTIETYLSASGRQGSATSFRLAEETPYYLNPTRQTFSVNRSDLIDFLRLEAVPVRMDGRIQWSTDCVRDLYS